MYFPVGVYDLSIATTKVTVKISSLFQHQPEKRYTTVQKTPFACSLGLLLESDDQ